MTKVCNHCKLSKVLSAFHRAPRYSLGVSGRCRDCIALTRSRNYRGNTEILRRRRVKKRAEYASNPDPVRAAVKAYRERTGYKSRRDPVKRAAQSMVLSAIRSGKIIKPKRCTECRRTVKIDGHHEDYSKPLDVIWLCRACHLRRHRKP